MCLFINVVLSLPKTESREKMTENSLMTNLEKVKGFDLNLLLYFEAIFVHKSVSKAAVLLGISPSAVSQSLTRLRGYFSDPLFVREGRGLVATTVAENLHTHLSSGFSQIINSLDYFNDSNTKSKFVIHSTPYAAMRLLPGISAQILNANLNCEIAHINSDALLETTEDALTYRKADIVFDTKPYYNFSTIVEPVIVEKPVPICRVDHPRLADHLSFDDMKKEMSSFLNVNSEYVRRMQTGINDFLGDRSFFISSSSIIVNASIVEQTDIVSFVPEWFARKFASSLNFKVLECEFTPEPVTLFMTYNKISCKNPTFMQLIELIRKSSQL